jgi:hypothetical protein
MVLAALLILGLVLLPSAVARALGARGADNFRNNSSRTDAAHSTDGNSR